MDKAWIALHVRTGTEADVLHALEAQEGAEALAPMEHILRRKDGCVRQTIRPLLPGYVLICWEQSGNLWHRIRQITGVIRILGGYPPSEIPKNQIAVVQALDAYCRAGSLAPASREDGRTSITGGPLAPYGGRIVSVNARAGRAKLAVELLDEQRIVSINIDLSKPAESGG